MTKEATNPKPSMILPSTYKNTCKFIYFEYAGAEKQTTKKVGFCHPSSSFSSKTLDKHRLQTKSVIEVLHAQNDIAFVAVALSARLSANWQEWRFG